MANAHSPDSARLRMAELEAGLDALAAHVERCYRAGYQDGAAENEAGTGYKPKEAWLHSREREVFQAALSKARGDDD